MNINEVKALMQEFDHSSLREFTWQNASDTLSFSKNETAAVLSNLTETKSDKSSSVKFDEAPAPVKSEPAPAEIAEGEALKSPLVGVAYLAPSADKAPFVQVGDTVKKGQTLLIIEAMKVMNEIPAPRDGVVTEILVTSEEVVEFDQELLRLK